MCCEKKLNDIEIKLKNKKSLCVVLCSNGYPDTYKKNIEIENIDLIKSNNDNFLFHAGTSNINKKIIANGGRVLNFVSLSDNFDEAKKSVYDRINKLNWTGGFCRTDIGYKVVDK